MDNEQYLLARAMSEETPQKAFNSFSLAVYNCLQLLPARIAPRLMMEVSHFPNVFGHRKRRGLVKFPNR